MTLDYPKHKNILLQILKNIFSDTSIAPYLGFKGGTAALMFYGLDRNSVDIDLDILDESKEREIFDKINLADIKSEGYSFLEELIYLIEKNKIDFDWL